MHPRVNRSVILLNYKTSACYVQTEIDCKALASEPDNRQ
jgi:hypothetical protein